MREGLIIPSLAVKGMERGAPRVVSLVNVEAGPSWEILASLAMPPAEVHVAQCVTIAIDARDTGSQYGWKIPFWWLLQITWRA